MLEQTRLEARWKKSSSSDELIDTSDEGINDSLLLMPTLIPGPDHDQVPVPPKLVKAMEQEQADKVILEAEQAKGRMFEVPGKELIPYFSNPGANQVIASVSQIGQDYQMVDSHVEEGLKCKIQAFEYVDFAKLISRSKFSWDEDGQRLEIINQNGVYFLSPVSDRDNLAVNSYFRWEQAFHVYSNILMAKFPHKATVLYQYGHTIHSASTAYALDNVYSYDREFRQHITRHPNRPWGVILQQAWTMILKDRIKHNHSSHKSKHTKISDPCRHYNRGKCTFGLSCKYEHRCSVKKCGKFRHGAHICRLRNQDNETKAADVAAEPAK